jgi:hypothetical protein
MEQEVDYYGEEFLHLEVRQVFKKVISSFGTFKDIYLAVSVARDLREQDPTLTL